MIVKDLELHFEVTYDYATDNQTILENIAQRCRAKLMETIMLDRVELEQRNYCKVNRFEVELNPFELRIVLDADINEQEVEGSTDNERLKTFKEWTNAVFKDYFTLETVRLENEEDEVVVKINLIPLDK
mgnify:CR=1 FL=1